MAINRMLIAVLLFISLATSASSQGYMGTVYTGTGIVPPLTVGLGSASVANVGASSSLANFTGSWSIDLKGQKIRHFDLQMLQESDLIMGYGQMTADGSSQSVAAAGSIAGDRPTVFISLLDMSQAFRLELSSSGTALAGEYDTLSAAGERESGTATGSTVLAIKQNSPTSLGTATNPSATEGAYVGSNAKNLERLSSSENLTKSRSFYQSTTGQGVISSDGGTTTISYR